MKNIDVRGATILPPLKFIVVVIFVSKMPMRADLSHSVSIVTYYNIHRSMYHLRVHHTRNSAEITD
jgi:hypothetical protein